MIHFFLNLHPFFYIILIPLLQYIALYIIRGLYLTLSVTTLPIIIPLIFVLFFGFLLISWGAMGFIIKLEAHKMTQNLKTFSGFFRMLCVIILLSILSIEIGLIIFALFGGV